MWGAGWGGGAGEGMHFSQSKNARLLNCIKEYLAVKIRFKQIIKWQLLSQSKSRSGRLGLIKKVTLCPSTEAYSSEAHWVKIGLPCSFEWEEMVIEGRQSEANWNRLFSVNVLSP